MSLTADEQRIIDRVFGPDPRDSKVALRVSVDRAGRVDLYADIELIPLYLPVVLRDLAALQAASDQRDRRAEAHR